MTPLPTIAVVDSVDKIYRPSAAATIVLNSAFVLTNAPTMYSGKVSWNIDAL